jgi:soluble lytic murein transglycosylase-like protein
MAGLLDRFKEGAKDVARDFKGDVAGLLTSVLGTAAGAAAGTGDWSPPFNQDEYQKYKPTIQQAAQQYNIPENILTRLLYQESKFDPDIVSGQRSSRVGAKGIAQFMPDTAASVPETGGVDPLDPTSSIFGAAHYLNKLREDFPEPRDMLAAYNWGRGNVSRKGVSEAPWETHNYYGQILRDSGMQYERAIKDKGLLGMTP